MITATVEVDLTRLKRFESAVSRSDPNNPIGKAIRQWAVIYRGFVYRRFDTFSKGGGDWPALAPSTIAGRRKGTSKSVKKNGKTVATKVAILRDTGILFMALTPTFSGAPGALQEFIPFGVIVGFGGTARHSGSSATIAEIASFHQTGGGTLPKRTIILEPDYQARRTMVSTMEAALRSMQ